ncbi:MAG: glycoside hydrolase family 42 [Negativicutes bacterium]|nr:glycoside hydrolase family 42 [Negativicutes bacterium]
MNIKNFIIMTACLLTAISTQAQPPSLKKQGTATQLHVDGKPMLVLGGELHNSSTSSIDYMSPIWPVMKAMNYNTVLAPVSWETIEPQEGVFDFTLVDAMLEGARKEDLKLVILWFASWKNGGSIYMPSWVKRDFNRFPRAKDSTGTSIEILSAFSEENMKADARAFRALMKHLREVDQQYHTVVMMQIENEVGILNTPMDFSQNALELFNGPIPDQLGQYLKKNNKNITRDLERVWKARGSKTIGTWEEVFGISKKGDPSRRRDYDWHEPYYYTEELFMGYYYAQYMGYVAAEGKKEYDIPMYVNAWLKGPDYPWTGLHPGGGPLPSVMDMYRCAAPSIDFLSPDIYVPHFTEVVEWYDQLGNPLFIPETRGGSLGADRLLWCIGEHNLIGFSPFGTDGRRSPERPLPVSNPLDQLSLTYKLLQNMAPIILSVQGTGQMRGMFVDQDNTETTLTLGDYEITADLYSRSVPVPAGGPLASGNSRSVNRTVSGGGFIIWLGGDQFLVFGRNLNVRFKPASPDKLPLVAVDNVYEGVYSNGEWIPGRLLNGDETHCSTFSGTGLKMPGMSIQKITLYRYR